MALWPQWIKALQTFEPDLRLQSPLIQLADDDDVLKRMQGLVERRCRTSRRRPNERAEGVVHAIRSAG